jgi:putative acetyltransferase
MAVVYTELQMSDYPEVIALWQGAEGVGLSSADSPERIRLYLERNPGMSYIAREDDHLIGAVLCGHDGRRGYLHHLAVRSDRRGEGIGRALVDHCLSALRTVGIEKCHLFVLRGNDTGHAFWREVGWRERVDIVLMSKEV